MAGKNYQFTIHVDYMPLQVRKSINTTLAVIYVLLSSTILLLYCYHQDIYNTLQTI